MSARWRLAVRRPIGQFCAHEGWLHGVPVAAPNGGYLRACSNILGHAPLPLPSSGPPAPATWIRRRADGRIVLDRAGYIERAGQAEKAARQRGYRLTEERRRHGLTQAQ